MIVLVEQQTLQLPFDADRSPGKTILDALGQMPYGSAFHFAAEEYLLLEGIENPFHCLLYVEFKVETGRRWLTTAASKGCKELKQAGIEVLNCVTYKDPRSFVLKAIDTTHQFLS